MKCKEHSRLSGKPHMVMVRGLSWFYTDPKHIKPPLGQDLGFGVLFQAAKALCTRNPHLCPAFHPCSLLLFHPQKKVLSLIPLARDGFSLAPNRQG